MIGSQILNSKPGVKFSMERIWLILTSYGQRVIRRHSIIMASTALTCGSEPSSPAEKSGQNCFKPKPVLVGLQPKEPWLICQAPKSTLVLLRFISHHSLGYPITTNNIAVVQNLFFTCIICWLQIVCGSILCYGSALLPVSYSRI